MTEEVLSIFEDFEPETRDEARDRGGGGRRGRMSYREIQRRKERLAGDPRAVVIPERPKLLKHVLRAGRIMQRRSRQALFGGLEVDAALETNEAYRELAEKTWKRLAEHAPYLADHGPKSWQMFNESASDRRVIARRRGSFVAVAVNETHGMLLVVLKLMLRLRRKVEFSADPGEMKRFVETVTEFREGLKELNRRFSPGPSEETGEGEEKSSGGVQS